MLGKDVPNSHWLVDENRGVSLLEITTGFYDDIWYTSSRPIYFYQKDIIGRYGEIWGDGTPPDLPGLAMTK